MIQARDDYCTWENYWIYICTSLRVVVMVIGLNTVKESGVAGTRKDGLLIKYP